MLQTFISSSKLFASLLPAMNASIFFIIGALFVATCIAVAIAAEWKVFVKAGKPGWAAIIPVYNSWVLFEISGKPGWWALIGLIPYVGWIILIVLYIIAMLALAKRFGKSATFAIFGLFIFQIIGFIILGYGSSTYNAYPDDERSFHAPSSE